MNFPLIIFVLVVSVIFALLEIQIEGENGWASKLPTWRLRNPLKKFVNWPYLTGYHFYVHLLFLFILQLPFLLGFPFNLKNEILIIEIFLLIMYTEDFFWFAFNPKWGLKRFFTEEVPWHSKKILFLPRNYWIGFVVLAIVEFIRIRV
jgi:hypothetical protein